MKSTWFNIIGLFFIAQTVITSSPVVIDNKWLELPLQKPLIARNSGASIQIDITTMVNGLDDTDKLDKIFKANTIVALMKYETGNEYAFKNESAYVFQNNHVYIKLMPETEINKKTKYIKMKIKSSSAKLTNVTLVWINASL